MSHLDHKKTLEHPMICPSCGTQITTLRADRQDCLVEGMCCVCSFCGQFSQMNSLLVLQELTREDFNRLPFAQRWQMQQLQSFVITYIHVDDEQGKG